MLLDKIHDEIVEKFCDDLENMSVYTYRLQSLLILHSLANELGVKIYEEYIKEKLASDVSDFILNLCGSYKFSKLNKESKEKIYNVVLANFSDNEFDEETIRQQVEMLDLNEGI